MDLVLSIPSLSTDRIRVFAGSFMRMIVMIKMTFWLNVMSFISIHLNKSIE